MAVTQLADVVVPAAFTEYTIAHTTEKTRLRESGLLVPNSVMQEQLSVGAESFTVPLWQDLGSPEANISNDDPAVHSTPNKINAVRQQVRKSFLNNSWSSMNLASELAGADAQAAIQGRIIAYWERQIQRRMVATLNGVMAANVASDSGDMVLDISGESGTAANFSAAAVIDACGTLGDSMNDVVAIAMHSDIYRVALKNDLIDTIAQSDGSFVQTFRGLAIVVDDGLPMGNGNYTSVLFGQGVFGYGLSAPNKAAGTEVENLPSAGRGGGQQVLYSRINLALHPLGFTWQEAAIADESPSITELADPSHWKRILERKAVKLAFLVSK